MAPEIIYVLKSCGLAGGVKVVLEHVTRLCERGYDAKVYFLQDHPGWFNKPVPCIKFDDINKLLASLYQAKGIKVATWYETALWVAHCINQGDEGYYLVQDIEDHYATDQKHKNLILDTYKLGLKPITEGQWVTGQLTRMGLEPTNVGIGIDFQTFAPVPHVDKVPCQVLTQCRLWSAGPENLKGWHVARRAVEAAYLQNKRISFVTFGIEPQQQVRFGLPYTHFRYLSDDRLNEQYNMASMYLMTSNHEGFGLTAAEAMATSTPVIATRAQGNEEFCIHNETALLTDVNDHQGLAKHIHHLIENPDRASELAAKGFERIKTYNWDKVVDRLEDTFFKTRISKVGVEFPKKRQPDLEYPDMSHLRNTSNKELATIIIPTVNDYAKVEVCVGSLRNTTLPYQVKIIVVDDGTKDDQIRKHLIELSKRYDFELLFNGQNLGFSASVNNGMLYAHTGRYIILCNNDIRFLQKGWLETLVGQGDADPGIAVMGCKLLYPDNTIQHAGVDKQSRSLHISHIARNEPADTEISNISRPVWAVTGAVFAIKKQALVELGGLSTAYCTAWEDIDYCFHAWNMGWKVWYCADVQAVHIEGATRGFDVWSRINKPLIWLHRDKAGSLYMGQKWAPAANLTNPEELKNKRITGTII